jgi:hypothetical protein
LVNDSINQRFRLFSFEHAGDVCRGHIDDPPGRFKNISTVRHVGEILRFSCLASTIEDFWLTPDNRQTGIWTEHCDINEVMLATSLMPEGFLSV